MNLIAIDASAQRAPTGGGTPYRRPPFYSRFHTNGTAGIDVLNHNMSNIPGPLRIWFSYCFSPPSLVGVVLAHTSKFKARAMTVGPNTRASWLPMKAGAEIRSVQIASKCENSQFFRVHHQRDVEPCIFGRGGMRAVRVDFSRNISLYKDNHAHHKDTQHPRTSERAHIRTVRSVHPPQPLTLESVHTAHFDYGHRNPPVHGDNAYARPARPHQSATLAPTGHVR